MQKAAQEIADSLSGWSYANALMILDDAKKLLAFQSTVNRGKTFAEKLAEFNHSTGRRPF